MHKFITTYLLTITLLLTAEPAYLKHKQAFGMKASNIGGYGVYYGYKPLSDLRIQAAGIYYMFDSELGDYSRHKITNYTLGLEIQKDLLQEEKARLYLMAGGYYYYDHDEEIAESTHLIQNNSLNYGVGVGYEFYLRRVTIGAEIGYKFYDDQIQSRLDQIKQPDKIIREAKLGAGLTIGFIF